MTKPTFNLAKLREARFEGATRADLVKAYQLVLGTAPADSLDDAALAATLRQHLNIPDFQPGGAQLPPGESPVRGRPVAVVEKIGKLGRIPNLGSVGKWEGRMRRVQFGPVNNPEGTISLGWNGDQKWVIKVPDVIDMPWPYWETIKTRVLVDDRSDRARKWQRNEETQQLEVLTKPIRTPLYQFTDLGDVPGTEGLPTSYFEYFQREAERTQSFRGFGRQALVMIYNRLHDTRPSTFFEKKDVTDLRIAIATTLGPKYLDIVNEELYGAEEASA